MLLIMPESFILTFQNNFQFDLSIIRDLAPEVGSGLLWWC